MRSRGRRISVVTTNHEKSAEAIVAHLVALPISLYVCGQFTYIMAVKNYTTYAVSISPLLYIIGGICLFLAYKIAIRAVRGNIKTKEWKTDTY